MYYLFPECLPDLGVLAGRGPTAAAVGRAGPRDHGLGELLRVVRQGAPSAAAGCLLGQVASQAAGGAGAGGPGAACAGPVPHRAAAGQGRRCREGTGREAPGGTRFPIQGVARTF